MSTSGAPRPVEPVVFHDANGPYLEEEDLEIPGNGHGAFILDHPANARRAAWTARSTSAEEPRAMRPATFSVDGSSTSRVFGRSGGTHSPSM